MTSGNFHMTIRPSKDTLNTEVPHAVRVNSLCISVYFAGGLWDISPCQKSGENYSFGQRCDNEGDCLKWEICVFRM